MTTDLNHIFYFAKIVEHGGLSKAGIALGVSKSVLSEHLAKLEAELGVRLLQRTTRRLQITEIGARYYQRCRAALQELDRAACVIDDVREIPRGRLRITSPINFSQIILAPLLTRFLAEYPEVEVALDITNRDVDVVAENYDFVLQITPNIRCSNLVTRSFTLNRHVLFASPSLIARHGLPKTPEALKNMPSVGGVLPGDRSGRHVWLLTGPDGAEHSIAYHPRLLTEDLWVIKKSAVAGCGVADLPPQFCQDAVTDGRLVQLLPEWSLPLVKLYAIYPSRQGLTLASRTFIEYLADHLRKSLDAALGNWATRLQTRAVAS